MKIETKSRLFGALATVCCLSLVPACAGPEEGSELTGEFAGSDDDGEDEDQEVDAGADEAGDDAPEPDAGADGEEDDSDGEADEGDTGGDEDDDGDTGGDEDGDGDTGGDEEGEGETDTTGDEPPMAELDGDSEVNPAVHVQFRNTSPAPVSIDAPLFNDDVIDTRGVQYFGEVSNPGDQQDFVMFNIVPGQVDPYIRMRLDCGEPDLGAAGVRAHLYHEDGSLLETVVCGDDEEPVLLDNANSNIDYLVRIEVAEGAEHFDYYSLSINGFCFQQCDYQPYEG